MYLLPLPLAAQTDPIAEGTDIRPFTAGGSISFMGQIYSATGIENRRAPSKAQISANTNFSLFGLQSGLNLFYSTDQSKLRQNMNDISFDGSYKWLTLRAGDVSPTYSTYGLGAVTLRGGSVELSPGQFQFKTAIGRSQRAVRPGPNRRARPTFEQWIYAGKVGFGEDDGTHFHLSTMYARDYQKSLANMQNLQIKPRKNITVTPDFGLQIVPGHLSLKSAVTFSALTRDMTSKKLSLGLPGIVTGIFQPRTSSRFNYAGQVSMNAQIGFFSMGLAYNRVQPGFASLGKHRVRDDYRSLRVSPGFRLFNGKLNINSTLSFGRNNLLNNQLSTRRTRNYMFNVQTRITPMISLNASYNRMLNKNIPASDTLTAVSNQRHLTNNIQLQPTATLRSGSVTHSFALTASYLTSRTQITSPGPRPDRDFSNSTITTALTYSVTLPSNLSINGSGNYLLNNSENVQTRSYGLSGGASYSLFENDLRLSLNLNINQNITERPIRINRRMQQLGMNFNASYQLTSKDSFQLTISNRKNTVVTGRGRDYAEFRGQFQYSHQF